MKARRHPVASLATTGLLLVGCVGRYDRAQVESLRQDHVRAVGRQATPQVQAAEAEARARWFLARGDTTAARDEHAQAARFGDSASAARAATERTGQELQNAAGACRTCQKEPAP